MKKVISISLALLVLLTNLGFTINSHLCCGEVVETSLTLGKGLLGCGMESEKTENSSGLEVTNQIGEIPCCDDLHQTILLDSKISVKKESIKFNKPLLFSFIHVFIKPIYFSEKKIIPYRNCSPPILRQCIQSNLQVFLI